MGLGTGATAAIVGGISAAGGIASSVIGANAAGDAAQAQKDSAGQALDFQKQVYADQQKNQAPFIQAGQTSIGQLMTDIGNGTFGPGSIGPAPTYTGPGTFAAPTLAEARATPGYQFTLQQGLRGVDAGAAARGGALSGAAVKAENNYAQGTADSTYGDVFNRSLSTYGANLNAGLTDFNAQQAQYQDRLAAQGQEYNQLAGVAGVGQTAVQNINQVGTATASNVGNLMTQAGNATASGIVGQANAINNGIGTATSSINEGLLLKQLYGGGTTPGLSVSNSNPNASFAGPGFSDPNYAGYGGGVG